MDTPSSSNELPEPRPRADQDQPTPPPPPSTVDASYFEKLLAYIPADMVAGYLAIDGVLKQSLPDIPNWIYWATFGAMLVFTPLYIYFRPGENSILKCSLGFRTITGTFAFSVWVFALGGPFAVTFTWYKPVYGSLLLIITTLGIPIFEKIRHRQSCALRNRNAQPQWLPAAFFLDQTGCRCRRRRVPFRSL